MKLILFLFRCCFLLSFSASLFAQGVFVPPQTALKSVNGITTPIAGATITVCPANAAGMPCSPALVNTIFADAALTLPLANPFTADVNGNYQFAIAPGTYTVTVTALGYSGYSYQVTAGGVTSGGGVGLIGNFTPGCIPVASPAGSSLPLSCSSLTENGSTIRTSEPILTPFVTGTAPNTGADLTAGDGSGFNLTPGHSYLWGDTNNNGAYHAAPNGVDHKQFLPFNPSAPVENGSNDYTIDGINYISTCTLLASGLIAPNSAVTIHSNIREDFNCDPFNTGNQLVVNLFLSRQTAPYTTTVPWTLNQSTEILQGWGRGRVSQSITHGSTLALNPAYVSPYVSANPSGFTIAASAANAPGCGGVYITPGTYFAEVTWGPDIYRETPAAQETAITIVGNECIQFTPPNSPPSPVSFYNAYVCHPTACLSGTEQYQNQFAIGTTGFITAFTSATGQPPNYNFTGGMVIESAKQPASRQNFIFGVQIKNLSLDCVQQSGFGTGCINAVDLSAEEESGLFYVDGANATSMCFGWEEYSVGLGASNSDFQDVECAPTAALSVANVVLDQVATMRGIHKGTFVASAPTGIIATGNQATPYSGTAIYDVHIERASVEGIKAINLALTVNNATCSPANVPICFHVTSTAKGSSGTSIRGGVSDVPLVDDGTGYNPSLAFVGNYINALVAQINQLVGPAPSVSNTTGCGATCTGSVSSFSNNFAGKINIATSGGGESNNGTLELDFSGNYGQNNVWCVFTPWQGASTWNARVSVIGTTNGTGHVTLRWDNNAVNLGDGTNYSFTYHCGPV